MSSEDLEKTGRDAGIPLDRRLVIVTGKGGTGKTSVAATLALSACQRGKRVLLAETSGDECLANLIAPEQGPAGYSGREVMPGLTVMQIDPRQALGEYLELQIGMRTLLDSILDSQGFSQLMEAIPGWRELITLGKIWHLEQMESHPGTPLYDLIVVDAPATGHGLTFLDVPRVVVSAVRSGPLRANASMVEAMVRDAQRTQLVPVTLPEELPVEETAQLIQRARNYVGITVGPIVVNGVAPRPYPPDLANLGERLAALPNLPAESPLPSMSTLAHCARNLQGEYERHQAYVEKLKEEHRSPVVILPRLADGVRGPTDLQQLVSHLDDANRVETLL